MAPTEYIYTKLNDLQVGDKFNVYGIITEIVKENGVTRSGRLHSICRVRDDSLPPDSTFRMHFFIPSNHTINGLTPGNILRLHRVKVEEYQGVIDGRVLSGNDVVIFTDVPKDETYFTAAKHITLTDSDKKRLEELREMLQVEKMFDENTSSMLIVTDSQRIGFKYNVQSSGSEINNGNTNKSNGEDKDYDIEEEIVDPETYQSGARKVINPACTSGNVVPNPFYCTFMEKKSSNKKDYKENEEKCDENISHSNTSLKRHFDVATTSTVNCKKPFSFKNRCFSSKPSDLPPEMTEKTIASNCPSAVDQTEGFEPSSAWIVKRYSISPRKKQITLNNGTDSLPVEEECPRLACVEKQIVQRKSITSPCKKQTTLNNGTDSLPVEEECPRLACVEKQIVQRKSITSPCKKQTTLNNGTDSLPVEEECPRLACVEKQIVQRKSITSPCKKQITLNNGTDSLPVEEECPGLACVGKQCALDSIILLNDDDPLIADFDEKDLLYEGLGDIPAVDDEGNIITLPSVPPFGDGSRAEESTISDLLQFHWPRHRSKVKIVKIKPNMKCSRNLLSGICYKCGRYSFYSQLKWKREPQKKKPICPYCIQDGKMMTVAIEFRVKFTVQDNWGTTLDVYAVNNHASKFLGCSAKEYQEDERCRERVFHLLAKALRSNYFTVTLFRMQTMDKSMFYICETELAKALSEVQLHV